MAHAIVEAVANYQNPSRLAAISTGLGQAIAGVDVRQLTDGQKLSLRGW
jgi:pyridoxal 5'-phosphate synthase pdxS subunit